MDQLQALITGMIAGSLLNADFLQIEVEVGLDENGNYLPDILVSGKITGTELLVRVMLLGEDAEALLSQARIIEAASSWHKADQAGKSEEAEQALTRLSMLLTASEG